MDIRDITDTLLAFLRARIDDDEQEWRDPPHSLRSIAATMLGDVENRRQIIGRISSGDRTPEELLTLLGLATRYFDHPDYQPEWWHPDEIPGFQPEWWSSNGR
ncbi:hypothetical protein [Streptosporangium sp. NPDC051022]|uniref:DUF6221 family protein n=1 Tax=Streptosporangium sp. NPDC051022 TaxID=3155752 RepID=UPI003411F7A9